MRAFTGPRPTPSPRPFPRTRLAACPRRSFSTRLASCPRRPPPTSLVPFLRHSPPTRLAPRFRPTSPPRRLPGVRVTIGSRPRPRVRRFAKSRHGPRLWGCVCAGLGSAAADNAEPGTPLGPPGPGRRAGPALLARDSALTRGGALERAAGRHPASCRCLICEVPFERPPTASGCHRLPVPSDSSHPGRARSLGAVIRSAFTGRTRPLQRSVVGQASSARALPSTPPLGPSRACWQRGSLARRHPGALAPRHPGSLARCHPGSLAPCRPGPPAVSAVDNVVGFGRLLSRTDRSPVVPPPPAGARRRVLVERGNEVEVRTLSSGRPPGTGSSWRFPFPRTPRRPALLSVAAYRRSEAVRDRPPHLRKIAV